MGLPITPHEQRPYIRLKKRTGTFPHGSATYDPQGEFTLTLNENKPAILSARLDNTPRYGTSRYIDSVGVGDNFILVIIDSANNEDCLFYGVIESIEYQGENNIVELTAADHSVYGENVFLNSVIYQKFTSNEEVSMRTRGNDEYYTALPADTTEYAPIVIEMRQTYGCHLNAAWNGGGQENNNLVHHKMLPVYTAPQPDGFTLRTVGGLGRPDDGGTSFPEDTDPNSTIERPTSTYYGDPTTTNITSNRIGTNKEAAFSDGAKKIVAQVFTPYQDDQLSWIYFNICKCHRRYPSQYDNDRVMTNDLGSWGTNRDLANPDPAKIAALGFTDDGAGNWIGNNWGVGPMLNGMQGFAHVVGVPQGSAIDTANYGQPYNTFGPGMDLKVTLVKAVKVDGLTDDGSSTTKTKSPEHVPKGEFVPTSDTAEGYGDTPAGGTTWGDQDRTGAAFSNAVVLAEIIIEPDNPIPAPHYPAGANIVHNYIAAPNYLGTISMMDEGQTAAFTQFGWNLEESPISVEKGEKYALIFEMLGDPDHPKLDDGVDIGGDANPGFLSNAVWWGVGAQVNNALGDQSFSTHTEAYGGGELMVTALTNSSNGIVGYHGEMMWNPLLRSNPGYSLVYDALLGSSPYLDKKGPAITGNNFGHWELFDRISSQKIMAMEFNLVLEQGGSNYTSDMENVVEMSYFRGRHNLMNLFFSAIGGGWRILGEGLYWKLYDGEIRYDVGSAKWQPRVDVGSIKLARMDYYSNPASGGLLRAGNKSTVRDVVHAICAKVPQYTTVIVDGTGDGADDVYGTGFNDVSNYELSYWNAVNETAWESLERLAGEYDAKLYIKTDLAGNTTIVFEAKTAISDFTYSSPGLHQYTFSNRDEDPNNLKYLRYAKLRQDVGNMYTRFRVIGATPSQSTTPTQIPGLPTGSANETPIVWILDVPEIENILGYKKELEFKSTKNITSFSIAKKAAEALKIIYAHDQYSGNITVVGCHPLYDNASFGMMFDTNAIVRVMDKYAITGDSPTGTTNIFRVTGVEYASRDHVTTIKLTTVIETSEFVSSQTLLKELKKNKDTDIQGRSISELVYSSTVRAYASTGWTMDLKTAAPASLGTSASVDVVDGTNEFYIIGHFPPGAAPLVSDSAPATNVDVTHSATTTNHTLENSVYMYDKDNLIVIVRFAK